jgi:hypothetical protein
MDDALTGSVSVMSSLRDVGDIVTWLTNDDSRRGGQIQVLIITEKEDSELDLTP